MAAVCILYRPLAEKTIHLSGFTEAPTELREKPGQIVAQTTLKPNTNLRATLRDLIGANANVARSLPTEEALCQEIEELCLATLVIDQAFYDIGRKLSDATREQNKRADIYDACHVLETQWNEHHTTYKQLLWRSREFAGEAQGAVDDFRELVLPSLRDQDRSQSEKKDIIQKQLKLLQDLSQPSQNLSQEFLDFGRALDSYIAEFSIVVETLEIDDQSQRVSGLESRLRTAKEAMEAVNKEVKQLGWKFAGDVAVAGITLLLAFVTPTWWAKLADTAAFTIDCMKAKGSGTPFFEAQKRCDAATIQYEAIKVEYELERASLSQMVKLESALHDSRPLVQEVTMRLGIFANVWAAITADIRKLKSSLHHADDPTSPLFTQRVQRLEKMYGYLSQALRHYQVTVWPRIPGELPL